MQLICWYRGRTRPLHIVHISKLGFLFTPSKYCNKEFFLNIASFYRMFLSTILWLSNLIFKLMDNQSLGKFFAEFVEKWENVTCLIQYGIPGSRSLRSVIFVNHCCQVRPGFRQVAPKSSATFGKNSADSSQKIVPKHPIGLFIFKRIFSKGNIVVEHFFCHFSATFGKIMLNFGRQLP